MISKKIVLSKDKRLLAILENSFFQREGFELVMLEGGQSGCGLVEAEAPALAIFSIAVMGDQAIACCRGIKTDPLLEKTGILLLLPEHADDALVDRCWDAGCDAVIHHPLSVERLLNAACNLLQISHRLDRRFPVNFHLAFTAEDQNTHEALAINMNLGGMYLAADQLFPVNTRLMLEFTLPGFRTAISCLVRVAWVNHPEWIKKNTLPCGMGVQFLELGEATQCAFVSYLDNLFCEGRASA